MDQVYLPCFLKFNFIYPHSHPWSLKHISWSILRADISAHTDCVQTLHPGNFPPKSSTYWLYLASMGCCRQEGSFLLLDFLLDVHLERLLPSSPDIKNCFMPMILGTVWHCELRLLSFEYCHKTESLSHCLLLFVMSHSLCWHQGHSTDASFLRSETSSVMSPRFRIKAEYKPCFCQLWPTWTSKNHLIIVSLVFLFLKMEVMKPTSEGWCEGWSTPKLLGSLKEKPCKMLRVL